MNIFLKIFSPHLMAVKCPTTSIFSKIILNTSFCCQKFLSHHCAETHSYHIIFPDLICEQGAGPSSKCLVECDTSQPSAHYSNEASLLAQCTHVSKGRKESHFVEMYLISRFAALPEWLRWTVPLQRIHHVSEFYFRLCVMNCRIPCLKI